MLLKPKAELEITTPSMALPGAALSGTVTLQPHEQVRPRGVRAELTGEETYYVRQTTTGTKGQQHTRIVRKVSSFATISQVLAETMVLISGSDSSWPFSLALPLDAPPSSTGKLVDIRWKLKAVLDVPLRLDQVKEVPITINSTPPSPDKIDFAPAERRFGECTLVLEVPRLTHAGEVLLGRLGLQASQKMGVRGIRVELVQIEDAGARNSNQVVGNQELSGAVSFSAYESPSFQFSLTVPASAPPTSASPHSSLRWQLKAILDRPMRTDFNVAQEIHIYGSTGE